MISEKFMRYGIKTSDNFLAKDSRTNCLEIYEDKSSADRVINNSSQDIAVVSCFVYTRNEHEVANKMYDLLSRLVKPSNCKKDIIHLLGEADSLLAKARGE